MAPQREGVFYPSALGNPCDRFLYFAYTGQLKGQPLDPTLRRIFDTGNALEERLEKYFTDMGIYIDREIIFQLWISIEKLESFSQVIAKFGKELHLFSIE